MRALMMKEQSGGGWQPGANTVAYYPLDSTNTVNDLSGNGHTLTNNGTLFGTYQGVDCAYFNNVTGLKVTGLLNYNNLSGLTICAWFYVIQAPNDTDGKIIATNGSTSILFAKWLSPQQYYMEIAGGTQTNVSTIGERILGVVTSNGTNNTLLLKSSTIDYVNTSITPTWSTLGSDFSIGNSPTMNRRLIGYVSKVIVENRGWTLQEITDYYNQTKGDYGIS